jgi:hypothetical protein
MKRIILILAIATAASAATRAKNAARGEYLVTIIGCNDCHTPLKMGPHGPEPDMTRRLSGHPQQLQMPPAPKLGNGPWMWTGAATSTAFAGPWGVSFAANLTPDRNTGIGIWSEDLFVKTLRTGRHWGTSRPILPPMPWQAFSKMTDDDLRSIYRYLRTIQPIQNQVPDPILAPAPVAATPKPRATSAGR